MSREITVIVHSIEDDGLPPRDGLTGRVSFIFDGCEVSGWPLYRGVDRDEGLYSGEWEADSDVGKHGTFRNVTHWLEWPKPMWEIEAE